MPRKSFIDLAGSKFSFEGRIMEEGVMVYHSDDPDEIRETLAAFVKAERARRKPAAATAKTKA